MKIFQNWKFFYFIVVCWSHLLCWSPLSFFPFFTTSIEYSNYSVQVENAVFSYKCIISKAEHSPGLVMVTVWSRYPPAGRDRSHNSETSHASQEQVALNPGLLRQDRCGDEKWELLPERDAALKNQTRSWASQPDPSPQKSGKPGLCPQTPP